MKLTKLPWMSEEEFHDLASAKKQFQSFCTDYKDHPMMKNFARDKTISMVFNSNKLENTLPIGVKYSNTCKLLENISLSSKTKITAWDAGGSVYRECQLIQHIKAYYYLLSQKQLILDVILETHRILMLGAVDDNGNPIWNGKLRKFGVNNGIDNHMHYEEVPTHLENLIEWYRTANNTDSIETAYKLFWNFLKIHPFQDGNGRIGRLLVAYHLFASGMPFPVCITSGKKRSRKHCYDATKKKSLLYHDRTDLYPLICYSVYLGWKNFLNLKTCSYPK